MSNLPMISGIKAIKVFNQLGFEKVRQKGSHVVLRRGNRGCLNKVDSILKMEST